MPYIFGSHKGEQFTLNFCGHNRLWKSARFARVEVDTGILRFALE